MLGFGLAPAPDKITLAQVAFYDNGEPPKRKKGEKAAYAKPRFMTSVDIWTEEPDDIDLFVPQWSGTNLLVRHRELATKLRNLLNPRQKDGRPTKPSITEDYARQILTLYDQVSQLSTAEATYYGLFYNKRHGTNFLPHQFIVLEVEHGVVNTGMMILSADAEPIVLKFDQKYSNGKAFASTALKGQARYEPIADSFKAGWSTC